MRNRRSEEEREDKRQEGMKRVERYDENDEIVGHRTAV